MARPRKTAASPLIPGENARAYRGRLKAWTGSLEPRNPVELYLLERAVALSWQLDRADRVQIERLSAEFARGLADGTSDHDQSGERPLAFDDSEAGERIRRYQLACGRALNRTLRTFVRLREIAEIPELTIPIDPTDRASEDADEPGWIAPAPAEELTSPGGPLEVVQEDLASLTMILATIDTGEPLRTTDVLDRRPDDRLSPQSRHEAEGEGPQRPRSSSRRRGDTPRDRLTAWSTSRGPAADADAARRGPVCRTRPRPGAPSAPVEGRRRVGGYEVPLDCSAPVSCADRIPVRLRREAAARR